jgi:hypothetical protein
MSGRNTPSVLTLLIVCLAITLFVACQRSVRHGDIRDQQRARMLQQIKKELELKKRLHELKGATAAEVSTEFAAPAQKLPCGAQCSFYDIDGIRVFVCFDQTGKVTCSGTVSLIQ